MSRGLLVVLPYPRRPESMFDGVEMPVVILSSYPRGRSNLQLREWGECTGKNVLTVYKNMLSRVTIYTCMGIELASCILSWKNLLPQKLFRHDSSLELLWRQGGIMSCSIKRSAGIG